MRRPISDWSSLARSLRIWAAAGVVLLAWVCQVVAGPYVVLGPSDGLALDQPRVQVEVFDDDAPGGPKSLGPEFLNEFLLDTGATGVVVVGTAANDLLGNGYVTEASYFEQGVAGFTEMKLSKPYHVDYAGSDGQRITLPQTDDGVRMMLNETVNFGSFQGIMGMPGMVNRVTDVDFSGWLVDALGGLTVDFPDQVPAADGSRYTIPLQLVDFPLHGQEFPDDPLPTFAPLPYAPVRMRNRGNTVDSEFIVDTGAQLSIISTQTAAGLGIDVNTEAVDFIPVGGIGGEVIMPVVPAESLGLLADEGELIYTDLLVGVLDIDPGIPGEPSIAGVLGMDFLTSGWLPYVFGELLGLPTDNPSGYLSGVTFDFRDAGNMQGEMIVDVLPYFHTVYYEGDVNGDGTVDIFDVAVVSQNWGGGPGSPGDANQDGVVDIFDVAVVSADWGQTSGVPSLAAGVPEPGGAALALLGLLTIVGGLRCGRPTVRRR